MNFLQCPHFDRSHEAPSVKQSRGSGLYSDVSLKHPSRDPADQMLDDTEEQPMQDDPVYANRYCIDCQSDVSQLLSEVYKPNMHVSAIQVTVVKETKDDFHFVCLPASGIWPIHLHSNLMMRTMQMQFLERPQTNRHRQLTMHSAQYQSCICCNVQLQCHAHAVLQHMQHAELH